MAPNIHTRAADLIERVIDLLAEAEALTDEEVRRASRTFTTAPSGELVGGISRGGQRIKTLALVKQAHVERIALAHNHSFPDPATEALAERLMGESDFLDMLFSFEIIDRFGREEARVYQVSRGFELWARTEDHDQADEEEESDDFDGILPFIPK